MSADVVECGAEEGTLPDLPSENASQAAPPDTCSSLKVSQQEVDHAAGAGLVEVRHRKVTVCNSSLDTESSNMMLCDRETGLNILPLVNGRHFSKRGTYSMVVYTDAYITCRNDWRKPRKKELICNTQQLHPGGIKIPTTRVGRTTGRETGDRKNSSTSQAKGGKHARFTFSGRGNSKWNLLTR